MGGGSCYRKQWTMIGSCNQTKIWKTPWQLPFQQNKIAFVFSCYGHQTWGIYPFKKSVCKFRSPSGHFTFRAFYLCPLCPPSAQAVWPMLINNNSPTNDDIFNIQCRFYDDADDDYVIMIITAYQWNFFLPSNSSTTLDPPPICLGLQGLAGRKCPEIGQLPTSSWLTAPYIVNNHSSTQEWIPPNGKWRFKLQQ